MTPKPRTRIFAISLPRARARRLSLLAQLLPTGWDFEIVDGIDGRKMKRRHVMAPYDAWKMTVGEVAVHQSHLGVLQRIVDYDLDYGIILEDDCILLPDTGMTLGTVCDHLPPDADCVMLHNRRFPFYELVTISEPGERFNRMADFNICTWGYIVSRRYAEYILREHSRAWCPIDHLYIRLCKNQKDIPFGYYETTRPLVDAMEEEPSVTRGAPLAWRDFSGFFSRTRKPSRI